MEDGSERALIMSIPQIAPEAPTDGVSNDGRALPFFKRKCARKVVRPRERMEEERARVVKRPRKAGAETTPTFGAKEIKAKQFANKWGRL
jgi:hypothetical protein